jgi:hypothetical protein
MNQLKDYIVVIDDIIPNNVVDMVFSEYINSDDWIPAIIKGGEDSKVRNCSTIGLSFEIIIQKNLEIRQKIDSCIFDCASKAIQEYKNIFSKCGIEQDNGYELLKYGVNGFYVEHIDSFKDRPRAVSCSFILNDGYEGGEFAFFDRELKYKPKKGSCIMFPSNFMYPHEIMPVTSGTRYSIITWFV